MISEVLEDAYKAVGELDDAAYFAMLEKVLGEVCTSGRRNHLFYRERQKTYAQGYMEKYMKQRRRKAEA